MNDIGNLEKPLSLGQTGCLGGTIGSTISGTATAAAAAGISYLAFPPAPGLARGRICFSFAHQHRKRRYSGSHP